MITMIKPGKGAHEQIQKWRRENNPGFIINEHSAIIHYHSECTTHLGDMAWKENRPSWSTLGNYTKILSTNRAELIKWWEENSTKPLKECKHCMKFVHCPQ